MRELKLNPDDSLNILSENKTYAMTFKSIASGNIFYYLNIFVKKCNVHYFTDFKIDSFDRIIISDFPVRFFRHKYLQYSINNALLSALRENLLKISVWEFNTLKEFIDWYKSNQICKEVTS